MNYEHDEQCNKTVNDCLICNDILQHNTNIWLQIFKKHHQINDMYSEARIQIDVDNDMNDDLLEDKVKDECHEQKVTSVCDVNRMKNY